MKNKITAMLSIILSCFCISNSIVCYALTPSDQTTTAERNAIAYRWTYYQRGYREYNCLSYALGNTSSWTWPWGDTATESEVTSYLSSKGYSKIDYNNGIGPWAAAKICSYGWGSDVRHFAKVITVGGTWTNDIIRAKWGACELFNHPDGNPYTNYAYGPLLGKYK